MKVLLTKSVLENGKWQVEFANRVRFTGGRVAAKKFANNFAKQVGHTVWYNHKDSGAIVEIKVR